MTWQLQREDLVDLARGAAFLGTGGGGDPYIGRLLVERAIDEFGPVTMVSPDELGDDDFVVPTSMMGAPTVMVEKFPEGSEPEWSLDAYESQYGVKATHTMPVECGGINSMIPLLVGARRGIPVVDGDGMGRAFPELQMETFGLFGVSGAPLIIASESHETIAIDTGTNNRRLEWIARAVTVSLGGAAMLSSFGMTGAQVRQSAIPGTVSMALMIGRCLRETQAAHGDVEAALREALKGTPYDGPYTLFTGKVTDVSRQFSAGFSVGHARIAGDGPNSADTLELTFQNENLTAIRNGSLLAIVPDLICVVEADSLEPITTEHVRYGQRVQVLALGAPAIMTSEAGLGLFGPSEFGLEYPYSPVGKLIDA